MKMCFKCKVEKPLTEFYAHPQMADGTLNKCKECAKADVREHYQATIGERHMYDRGRSRLPDRREACREYNRLRRLRNPEKAQARNAVGNAIRDGRLTRLPCEVCGAAESEAHHEDYSKPLDVRWLCFVHHREAHGQVVTAGNWRAKAS